ncbi:hypothetical protein Scep_020060 [Stephania cephalantha]|uniref:Uncharacterized protein n=1 Tax=Stephania cephalantha TaxID=152367 RepID=A0AAP0NQG8_9MAGN
MHSYSYFIWTPKIVQQVCIKSMKPNLFLIPSTSFLLLQAFLNFNFPFAKDAWH